MYSCKREGYITSTIMCILDWLENQLVKLRHLTSPDFYEIKPCQCSCGEALQPQVILSVFVKLHAVSKSRYFYFQVYNHHIMGLGRSVFYYFVPWYIINPINIVPGSVRKANLWYIMMEFYFEAVTAQGVFLWSGFHQLFCRLCGITLLKSTKDRSHICRPH